MTPPTLIPISTPPDKWPVVGYSVNPSGFLICQGNVNAEVAKAWNVIYYHPMPVLPEPRVAWIRAVPCSDGTKCPSTEVYINQTRPPGEGWTRWEEKV